MSQTRQPIQVFPKITLKLGVWGRVGLILAIIAAIASYILYHNGVRYKDREKAHFQELSQHIKQLQQSQLRSANENVVLRQQIDALGAQVTQLKVGLEPEQRRVWLTKQVSRYVELAEQQLLLQGDIASAEILLEVADKLLADNADTGLLALRAAIAADKLALVTAQQVDKAGISLRLDALKKQANQYVAPSRHEITQAGLAESVPANDASLWAKGWSAFRQLIVVRHYDKPVQPLLAQDQRWLLQQNVYLALSQAQLALWAQQSQRYQQSLSEVEQLLSDYQQLNPQYAAILAEAKDLQTVITDVPVPTLSHTQQVLATMFTPVDDQPAAAQVVQP
jgi:uroporphyrin-3 C-methyltransferase